MPGAVRRAVVPVVVGIAASMSMWLAACANGPAGQPLAGDSSVASADGSASAEPTTTLPAGPQTASSTASPAPAGSFVITEGDQHSVCGMSLSVKFIPPSATDGSQNQAFLVGKESPSAGDDQPAPSTLAPARAGQTATVLGRQFRVVAVDMINARVTLEALC